MTKRRVVAWAMVTSLVRALWGCGPATCSTMGCPSGQTCGADMACHSIACSAGNPTGVCDTGQTCHGGACVTLADVCSAASPACMCPGGETCVAGACCATAQACGSACCTTGSVCFADASGNRACAQSCTTSSQCPATASCCSPLLDSSGQVESSGVCATYGVDGVNQCRCIVARECASGSTCAPSLNSTSNPQAAYVCKASDCGHYDGCGTLSTCSDGYCKISDSNGNTFCAQPCSNDTMCGGAHCQMLSTQGGCSLPGVCLP